MACGYCGKKTRAEGIDYCSSRCLQSFLSWGAPNQKPRRTAVTPRVIEDPFVETPVEISSRERSRIYALRRYGLTPEDFDKLFEQQNGVCCLCRNRRVQVIDHCHATGRVRGLLCYGCNSALGILGDNVAGIKRALEYLESDAVFTSLPTKRR